MSNPDATESMVTNELETVDLGDAMVETKQPFPFGPVWDNALAMGWG